MSENRHVLEDGRLRHNPYDRSIRPHLTGQPTGLSGVVLSAEPLLPYLNHGPLLSFMRGLNRLLALGAKDMTVGLSGLLPRGMAEEDMRDEVIRPLKALAAKEGPAFLSADLSVTGGISLPALSYVFAGRKSDGAGRQNQPKPGTSVFILGWCGMSALMLWRDCVKDLRNRFPAAFFAPFEGMENHLSIRPLLPVLPLCSAFIPLGEGGVLSGLWKMAEETGLGFRISLSDIPFWQETLEVADLFGADIYSGASDGAVIALSDREDDLEALAAQYGISAVRVGSLTREAEKVLELTKEAEVSEREIRYLDRPGADAVNALCLR